jgi:FADH2 O2-dependent halogenase
MNSKESCDILIIGASMAGGVLARHLKLAYPDLSITVLEKKEVFEYGIGESMLEIFWDYASDELKLQKYLDANYFYKHGLRFFFDSDQRDASLEQMSEMGRTWYHGIPAHQVDRSKFDNDLVEMNRAMGVDVRLKAQVKDVEIDPAGAHTVSMTDGSSISCRWLVDAGGFTSPLARKFQDVHPITEHPVSAAWGRVRHICDLDDMGSKPWRERVKFVNRSLSTNHFMYPGYWVWLIPLDENTYSIGVVWHHEKSDISIKNQKELEEVLFQHRWARDLFGERYEFVDFGAMKNMARIADRFFSEERWFRTGIAAGFIDPLFSSGSGLLTDLNRMIVDMIGADLAGDKKAFSKKVAAYDAYAHWWLDNFLFHITGNYHGNYQLHKMLFKALLMDYFGIVLPASLSRYWKTFSELPDEEIAQLRHRLKEHVSSGGAAFAHEIKDQLFDYLAATGNPYEENLGKFHDVEIPHQDMVHSLMRGRGFGSEAIEDVRKRIEEASMRDALLEASKRRADTLTPSRIDDIIAQFRAGRVPDLKQALMELHA